MDPPLGMRSKRRTGIRCPSLADTLGAVAQEDAELGVRLRAIRTARGHSLAAVAEGTGISTSFLSLVENGRNDITFGRLRRLIDFYDVTLADLLPPAVDPVVIRADDRRHLQFRSEGVDIFVLVPGVDDDLYAALGVYEPDSQLEEPAQFGGMLLVTVIEGTVMLELGGSEAVELHAGDSAYFSGARQRRIRTGPTEGARMVFVAVPSPFAPAASPVG